MAPHPGILVPQSEQPVAAQSAPSSNCICLTFLENRRKARKHMGILLLFAFPSPRHLAGASQRSRQVRGSARSLWYPDSFLTSCNCFPATTLLSRELLAKAICSPSIFISCFVHVKEGKQRGRRRTNRAGTCSGSTVLRERWEGFGLFSQAGSGSPDHHSNALCSPLQPTSLSDSFGGRTAIPGAPWGI